MSTCPTLYHTLVMMVNFRIKYRDSASYAKFTMSFYGAALGRRIAGRDIAAAKAKARTSFTKAIERKKRKAMEVKTSSQIFRL